MPHASDRITVTDTAETGADVSYEDGSVNDLTAADSAAGDQFNLDVGQNVIRIKVTRGGASQTYALAVTRGPVPSLFQTYEFTWDSYGYSCGLGPDYAPRWQFYVVSRGEPLDGEDGREYDPGYYDWPTIHEVHPSDVRANTDECSARVRIDSSYFPLVSCALSEENLCVWVDHTQLLEDDDGRYKGSNVPPALVELVPVDS